MKRFLSFINKCIFRQKEIQYIEEELAFYTNEELVKELSRRKTFLGIIVYAPNFKKGIFNNFKLHFQSDNIKKSGLIHITRHLIKFLSEK